jgi:hypothetical protein
MTETFRWFYEAAVERILRKRLLAHQDKWFLAGIDTAIEAAGPGGAAARIRTAREGYLQEIESRG